VKHQSKRSTAGFTIVEVLVAIVVLGVGVVAMAGSSALVTRMIGRGQRSTRAGQVAAQRLDSLRLVAYSTTPHCTNVISGGPTTSPLGVTQTWVVTTPSAKSRQVVLKLVYKNARGKTKTDTVSTIIGC
jgi:prepilin-type N-terminal cleavage/methylation domain-containing protein